MRVAASEDGLPFDIIVVVVTVAIDLVVVYIAIGVPLSPFAGIGWLLRVRTLRRAIYWWALPFLAPDFAYRQWKKLTRPRDPDRYRKSPPQPEAQPTFDGRERWAFAKGFGALALLGLGLIAVIFALIFWNDLMIEPIAESGSGTLVAALALVAAAGVVLWAYVLAQRYPRNSRPPVYRYAAAGAAVLRYLVDVHVDHRRAPACGRLLQVPGSVGRAARRLQVARNRLARP